MRKCHTNNKKHYTSKSERMIEQLISNSEFSNLENAIRDGLKLRTVRIGGLTPLEFAALNNNVYAVEWFVKNCPELMFADELIFACGNGNEEIVDILLAAGEDVNRTGCGGTPLRMAVQEGKINIVAKLLDHGADLQRFDEYVDAPLYVAAAEGNCEIVNLLLQRGQFVEKHKQEMVDSMIIAGIGNYLPIVKRLVANGADINGCDSDGRPLIFYAIVNNNDDLIQYLISQNCCTDTVDTCGISVKRMLKDASYRRFVSDAVKRGEL